jgi:hypothetical protein
MECLIINDSLNVYANEPNIHWLWDYFFTFVIVILGSGTAVYYLQRRTEKKKSENIIKVVKEEIKMNIDAMNEGDIQRSPHLSHSTFNSTFNAYKTELPSSKSQDLIVKVFAFYTELDKLRAKDIESQKLEEDLKEYGPSYGSILKKRGRVGKEKNELREKLMKIGKDALDSK